MNSHFSVDGKSITSRIAPGDKWEARDSYTVAKDVPQQDESKNVNHVAFALVNAVIRAESAEKTEQALAKLNALLKDRERELEFSVDDVTGRTILKVIHAESGEVIRQIPSEELLNVTRTFIEGTGSLIDALA